MDTTYPTSGIEGVREIDTLSAEAVLLEGMGGGLEMKGQMPPTSVYADPHPV